MSSPLSRTLAIATVIAAAAASTGCAGFRQAVGAEKIAPDEFRVVTKAPLSLPPDYQLRPPRPGDPRPQELRADQDARAAVFGQDIGKGASPGEVALVNRAGAAAVDPAIRRQVDLEGGAVVRKPESLADSVIAFGKDAPAGAPLTPEQEAERLKKAEAIRNATGGGQVVIEKRDAGRGKLPGL